MTADRTPSLSRSITNVTTGSRIAARTAPAVATSTCGSSIVRTSFPGLPPIADSEAVPQRLPLHTASCSSAAGPSFAGASEEPGAPRRPPGRHSTSSATHEAPSRPARSSASWLTEFTNVTCILQSTYWSRFLQHTRGVKLPLLMMHTSPACVRPSWLLELWGGPWCCADLDVGISSGSSTGIVGAVLPEIVHYIIHSCFVCKAGPDGERLLGKGMRIWRGRKRTRAVQRHTGAAAALCRANRRHAQCCCSTRQACTYRTLRFRPDNSTVTQALATKRPTWASVSSRANTNGD